MGRFYKEYVASCSQLDAFDVVDDTEGYSQLLPYCSDSGVIRVESASQKTAFLQLGLHGANVRLVTENTCVRPERIDVKLIEGPMSFLEGSWKFIKEDAGTRIQVEFTYRFENWMLEQLFEKVFSQMVDDVVNRFVARTV